LLVSACIGSTGSDLVTFPAFAAGPADANGQPLTVTNGLGWNVTITKAKLHIGAVYLNRSVPVSGAQERECFLPGVYVGEVLRGLDVDVLSSSPQKFPGLGNGTEDRAVTGEIWLTGERIDAHDDRTTIADVAGTATRDGVSMRFEATITIGENRIAASTDPARPGAHPLCKEQIVTPLPVDVTPRGTGSLLVRVDPRGWFANVEFGELEPVTPESDLRRFPDDNESQPASNLYRGLHAGSGVYTFLWMP
jgi:hypothetical protein